MMKTAPVEILTQRMRLSAVTPALVHALFKEKTKQEIMHYFGVDIDGFKLLKSMHEQGMETNRISFYYFLLIEKETNRVLGECGFHTWNPSHQRAELFYDLKNDVDKRKGLMTEALQEVLDFGFRKLSLHRVAGLTASWNTASKKILKNFGFSKEGVMREDYVVDGVHENSECYSLLNHEWNKMAQSTL